MLSYLLAVIAAGCNAASNVLQREANRRAPPEDAMRLQLILDLVRRPIWLAGLGLVVASFVLDAAALSVGRLAGVQPVLVLELPLTLIFASVVFPSGRIQARDWCGIGLMTVSLAGLIWSLDPSSAGKQRIGPGLWTAAVLVTVGVVVLCVAASYRSGPDRHPARRPALLGLASGITFGLTAAFMKDATGALHAGPAGVLGRWSTYAMVVSGLAAMFLMQNALQSGRLIAAQPGITLADPGVAILWGVIVFGEQVRGGGYALGAVGFGLALAAGVILLTRSPALRSETGPARAESKDAACEAS